jgi:Tol biopolymer transport system component
MRDGDLDLYSMDADGRGVRRLTRTIGYDGGAFFSPDGKRICFRAHRPQSVSEIQEYQDLLRQNLIRPSRLELFVMNADGTGQRQVTHNRAANFCPFFTPDGRQLLFSSNQGDRRGREFDLYLVNVDGGGQERITTAPQFDGFPMFSPDGKQLVWASNRNAGNPGDTNLFIADWIK